MKKIIVISISILLANFSFAQTINRWDCARIREIENIITSLYSDKLHLQALTNLKKFCNKDNSVLQSSYYINHYLDVAFRYLDGFEQESDPQAKQRRILLNTIAKSDYKNIKPSVLTWMYNKIRWISPWSLYQKYINTCNHLTWLNSLLETNSTNNNRVNIIWTYLQKCYQLANTRKIQETKLTQILLYKIHYRTLQSKLFKLLNQDFVKKRDNLYNQFVISLWDFMFLVRRFIKSTNANTK